MAFRPLPGSRSFTLSEFERAFDQVFEDLLISRWRGPHRSLAPGPALVLDHGDRYEVRIAAAGTDPAGIEVEAGERRLRVRMPLPSGAAENVFDFAAAVDTDAVSARWEQGTLHIILPKQRGRRVEVK